MAQGFKVEREQSKEKKVSKVKSGRKIVKTEAFKIAVGGPEVFTKLSGREKGENRD